MAREIRLVPSIFKTNIRKKYWTLIAHYDTQQEDVGWVSVDI